MSSQPEANDHGPIALACKSLHSNGCEQVLEDDWIYCPQCGSAIVGMTLREIGQSPMGNGGTRIRIEVRPVVAHATVATLEIAGRAHADRTAVSLAFPSSLNVDLEPGVESVSVRVNVPCVVRDPHSDPFATARDSDVRLTLSAHPRVERRIDAFPSLLSLRNGENARVEIHATSGAARLGHVDVGSGLDVTTEGTIVRPNDPAIVSITVRSLESPATTTFLDDAGYRLASVLVVPRLPAPMRGQARFLVGLDFGTSGTSVWRTDTLSRPIPESLLDGGRVPTAVYIDRPDLPSTWLYGEAALEARRVRWQGTLLTEFKRYLQEESDQLPDLGISATQVLAWYLRRLMEDSVLDRLNAASDGGRVGTGDVSWRFTMPVYDGGERSARYRARMLDAARAAGLDKYGAIEFVLEPECALRSLVGSGAFQDAAVQIGARVMVVDGGGGTTDVAIGTLVERAGTLGLEDVVSYEVKLPLARSNGRLCGSDFGGGDVTRLAGAFAIASYAAKGVGEAHYTRLAGKLNLNREGRAAFGFAEGSFFPLGAVGGYWHEIVPDLYGDVERVKLELANDSGQARYPVRTFSDDELTLDRADVRDSIGEFVSEYKETILRAVGEEVEAGRMAPTAYALVGGNHILLGPEVDLPDMDKVEANQSLIRTVVVAGAALPMPRHAPLCPFPLTARFDVGQGPVPLLTYDRTLVVDRLTGSANLWGEASGILTLEVLAEYEGPHLLRRFEVPFEAGTLAIHAELLPGRLLLRVDSASDAGERRGPRTMEVRL